MPTPPTENPQKAMSSFISGLQEAGMGEAAQAALAQKPAEGIAPAEPPAVTPPVTPPEQPKPAPAPAAAPAKAPEKPAEPEPQDDKWPRSAKDWDAYKAKHREKEITLTK